MRIYNNDSNASNGKLKQKKMKTIAVANDHAGTIYKFEIMKKLESQGYKILDFGTDSEDSMDYPDSVHPLAESIENKKADFGIIICGSGNGAQMTANKHQGVRAALCWENELAELSRRHNDANVLSIPSRFVSIEEALMFVETFLTTKFEGGRHQNRVSKIPV